MSCSERRGAPQAMMGPRLPRVERWFLYALVPLTLALSVAGVYSSVRELIDQFSSHRSL